MPIECDATKLVDFFTRLTTIFGVNAEVKLDKRFIVIVKGNGLSGLYSLYSDLNANVNQLRDDATEER